VKTPDRDHQHKNVDNHRNGDKAAAQPTAIGEHEAAASGKQAVNPECPRYRLEWRPGRERLGRDRVEDREEHGGNLRPADNNLAGFSLPFDTSTDVLGKGGLCPPAESERPRSAKARFSSRDPGWRVNAGCCARLNNIDTSIAWGQTQFIRDRPADGYVRSKQFPAHLCYAVVPALVWTRGSSRHTHCARPKRPLSTVGPVSCQHYSFCWGTRRSKARASPRSMML